MPPEATTPTTPTPSSAPAPQPSLADAAAMLYPNGGVSGEAPPGEEGTASPVAPASADPKDAAPVEGAEDAPVDPIQAEPSAPEEPPAKEEAKPPEEAKPADGSLTAASYEVKLPEGMEVDEGLLSEAKKTFAAVGLDPKGAQPLIDLYAQALEAQNAANEAAWNAQDAKWRDELYTLPEFKGAMRKTSETTISRLLDEYGGSELRATLINAGLGNNPTLMKALLSIGSQLTEGAPAPQGGAAPVGKNGRPAANLSPGQIMYESGGPGSQPQQG